MTNKKFFENIGKRHAAYEQAYRKLIAASNDAQNQAKRAIFALHRDDSMGARALLQAAQKLLTSFESDFKQEPMLRYEGAYRAALEEFVEASLFNQFFEKKPLVPLREPTDLDAETYLGGLSDLTGELVRYAVSRATRGDLKEVRRAKEAIEEVLAFLTSLDLTGYLRQKYDQARNSLRRMEEIAYDLALKRR